MRFSKARRLSVSLSLVLGLCLFTTASASAHAVLLHSNPAPNAALVQAPTQIELYFTEALEASFSTISVLDANGQPMDMGDTRVDPADTTRLLVSLRSLPNGVYTVAWKALSSVDGHITTGAFPFAVGDVEAAALAAAAQASRQIKLSLSEVLARWLLYLSAALLTGGMLFRLLVWNPAYRAVKVEARHALIDRTPWRQLLGWAFVVWFSANSLSLLVQAGQAAGRELAWPWESAVDSILFTTRFGAVWAARCFAGLAVAGMAHRARRARSGWLALAFAALLLLTLSLGSHAAAGVNALLPIFIDWLHVLAASVWVGGLTHLLAGLWAVRHSEAKWRARLTARLLPRFSALALLSVGTLTATGGYAALLHIGSWSALTTTAYGQTLLVKLTLAVLMLLLGAVNLFIITPRITQARIGERFRLSVTTETILGALLLLSVGVLTALPPAKIPAPLLQAARTVEDLQMALTIAPGRVGLNTFTLSLTHNGQPVTGAKEVALRFTPTLINAAPSEAQLVEQGAGVYALKGAFFSLPDTWQVQAVVRRAGQFDAFANFDFDLRLAQANAFPWSRVTGTLLMLSALACAFVLHRLTRTQTHFLKTGVPLGAALFIVGLIAFYRPAPIPPAGRLNPIPPNADSVANGQTLYQNNCLACHGPAGKGDGPVGLTLNPRPADLSFHATPGVHTDGQLFEWISQGFPGSVMPKFNTVLSEEERWHVINFMRNTLAPK